MMIPDSGLLFGPPCVAYLFCAQTALIKKKF